MTDMWHAPFAVACAAALVLAACGGAATDAQIEVVEADTAEINPATGNPMEDTEVRPPSEHRAVTTTVRGDAYRGFRPDATCYGDSCSMRLTYEVGDTYFQSEPLPFFHPAEYMKDGFVNAMDESWAADVLKADAAWRIGPPEKAIGFYLKGIRPEGEAWGEQTKVLLVQVAGFDHISLAYRIYEPTNDQTSLRQVWALEPRTGPQATVTINGHKGLSVTEQVYDAETGDFIAQDTVYYWVYGDHGEVLLDRENAKIALGVESDAEFDELLNE